jgi:hypothetical protein
MAELMQMQTPGAAPTFDLEFFSLAERRFETCVAFERDARRNFINDMKFAHADSDNNWQWPDSALQSRELAKRPVLTINKTRQHNLQITNDAKENMPNIKIRASGLGTSSLSAEAYAGIVRYVEYRSNAPLVYDAANKFQVNGGVGYWRVINEYCDDESFDQDIKIALIEDPLMVYLDPDASGPMKDDMNFAFIFREQTEDNVKQRWPQYDPRLGTATFGKNGVSPFVRGNTIITCEYYERKFTPDVMFKVGDSVVYQSALKPEGIEMLMGDANVPKRSVLIPTVHWYMLAGRNVIDSKVIPSKRIPIVQIAAEEIRIENTFDRKSHTRALKDPQRMYNYWASSAVEFGALQTKAPWTGSIEAFSGHEEVWKAANTTNVAYLPYNQYDDDGNKLDAPKRVDPPVSAPLCMDGMRISQAEMSFVSGQYDNTMGQEGNERTGKAIFARQRKGDNATFHYIHALAAGIQYTGELILEMAPAIYDTPRTLMIIQQDGKEAPLQINPDMKVPYQEKRGKSGAVEERILNPKLGKYQVVSDTGPGYATQRQEAFEAFSLIMTQNPTMAQIIGDIMLRAGDFPGAEEAAERLRRMVPKAALGEGPSQSEQEMMQQMEIMKGTIQALMDQLVIAEAKVLRQSEKSGIEKYKAFSERLKIILDSEKSAQDMKMEITKLMVDLMNPSAPTQPSPDGKIEAQAADGDRPLGSDGGMLGQRLMSGD